jgi:hypothetical protein
LPYNEQIGNFAEDDYWRTARMTHARIVTIVESATGNNWTWLEHGRKFKSLASAIKADNADARAVADAFGKVVTVRTIRPNTRIGTLIARTLTQPAGD